MNLLYAARLIAKKVHVGQKYGCFDYYEYNLEGVVAMTRENPHSLKEALALLHEVLEYTSYTYQSLEEELVSYGCNLLMAQLIVREFRVLNRHEHLSYREYIVNICCQPIATKVKCHDRLFNLQACIEDNGYRRAERHVKTLNLLQEGAEVVFIFNRYLTTRG